MRHLGKEMGRTPISVGIYSAEEFIRLGSKEAFFRLKMRYPPVGLVH